MILFLLGLIVALTAMSAFCSMTEVAFFSLPQSRLKSWRHGKDEKKYEIADLLRDSKGLLVTIFLLNTIVNILVQNITSDLFDRIDGGFLLKVLTPLFLILIFGELLPKYLGLLYNEKIAIFAAPFYTLFQRISRPIRSLITTLTSTLSRILFFFLKVEKPFSYNELTHILDTSEGKGLLHEEETRLLKGYLSIQEKRVVDVMIPRNEVWYYDVELPLSKLIFLLQDKKLNQIPVSRGSLDTFLGMISAKDFLLHNSTIKTAEELLPYLFKPHFIPETTPLKMIVGRDYFRHANAALVIDEYGAISGLLSQNELLDLMIRKEPSEEDVEYIRVSHDTIIANGTMSLEELSEVLHLPEKLESQYHQITVAGFLEEKLGTIPQNGATYSEGPLLFRCLQAEPTRVKKVYIQKRGEAAQ